MAQEIMDKAHGLKAPLPSNLSDLTDMWGMGTLMELIRHGVGSRHDEQFPRD